MTSLEQIVVHSDARQGYTIVKKRLSFEDASYDYTEDTGTQFEAEYNGIKYFVSSVCDGHAGYMTSYSVTGMMKSLFLQALKEKSGDLEATLQCLFEKITEKVLEIRYDLGSSGTTCNVTVIDPQNEQVVIASLGDSPTLLYNKNSNNMYVLQCKTEDQDCADIREIERMVQIHKNNGDTTATSDTVVFEVKVEGIPSGVFRNKRTQCMLHASFGDFFNNYYPGMVTTVPRIYKWPWTRGQILVQCSDGLMESLDSRSIGIQPQTEFRSHEVANHLDVCENDTNVAHSLHEMQIDSMYSKKLEVNPFRSDTTRAWIETTFDNHITNVFMWRKL